jgi:predicted RNA-binding protein YlqC (UPF0109 family)
MNRAKEIAETLFPALCRALSIDPTEVNIEVKHGAASSAVVASPSPNEAGNLIGKKGATVQSMESLAKLIGLKHKWPVQYVLDNPAKEKKKPKKRMIGPSSQWDNDAFESLFNSTFSALLHHAAEVSFTPFGKTISIEAVLDDDEPAFALQVKPDNDELLHDAAALSYVLKLVFNAIGQLHNKTIIVIVLRRNGIPPQRQPRSAAGRYANELVE